MIEYFNGYPVVKIIPYILYIQNYTQSIELIILNTNIIALANLIMLLCAIINLMIIGMIGFANLRC